MKHQYKYTNYLIHVEEFEAPSMTKIDQFIDLCEKAREEKKVSIRYEDFYICEMIKT